MKRWTLAVALVAFLAPSLTAAADDYPSRPIRAIASQGPGGLSDLFMRALGDQLGPALGAAIVVEDRVGAEGTIGAKACADAAPDGYTICILPDQTIRHQSAHPAVGLRSVQGLGAGGAALLSDADIRGECVARRQILRRARGAGKVQAEDVQLHGAVAVEGRLHGRRSTRRTAPTSCACRSRAAATPSTPCSTAPRRSRSSASATWCRSFATAKSSGLAVDGDTRSPLAPDDSDVQGSSATPTTSRRPSSAFSRLPARRRRSSTS